MKIRKYINDAQSKGVASKLFSYSAMAAAFIASGPEAVAQCAGETASPGAPVGLDIDGDGTDDVQLFAGTISSLYASGNFTSQVGTVPVGTVPFAFAATGTLSTLNLTAPLYYGCYVAFGAAFPSSMLTVGPATAMATFTISAAASFVGAYYSTATAIYATGNYAFVTALGANQIVGLSATGTNVCGQIDSAPGVAGAGTSSLVGYDVNFVGYSGYQLLGGVAYDFPATGASTVVPIYTTVTGITCTTSTASIYGGYFAAGTVQLYTLTSLTVSPQDAVYPGPYLLGGPYYNGPISLGTANSNPLNAAAVQFAGPDLDGDGNPDTYNGWITFTYNADGTITCTGSGYQQCSIENAIATSGDAANGCMMVGGATNENPACMEEPPEPPADIPTTGEWGLIILGLMMSITAIVGIRQRREEEVVA